MGPQFPKPDRLSLKHLNEQPARVATPLNLNLNLNLNPSAVANKGSHGID